VGICGCLRSERVVCVGWWLAGKVLLFETRRTRVDLVCHCRVQNIGRGGVCSAHCQFSDMQAQGGERRVDGRVDWLDVVGW